MKKYRLFFFLIVLFLGACLPGQAIDREKAALLAKNYFNLYVSDTKKDAHAQKQTANISVWKQKDQICMYAVEMEGGGWVLVSGDERTIPVLAYGEQGAWNTEDMPPGMVYLLDDYAKQILAIREAKDTIAASIRKQWQDLENNRVTTSSTLRNAGTGSEIYTPGHGLLNTPSRGEVLWSQSSCIDDSDTHSYNKFCPDWYDKACGHTLTGCGAVAMCQIMWYWQWPHSAQIPVSIDTNGTTSSTTSIRYYDWRLMPAFLDENTSQPAVNMVAGFLRDCGYAAHALYKPNRTSINIAKAQDVLQNTFGYHTGSILYKASTSNWASKLRDAIDLGRPVYYRGKDPDTGSTHAFVVDGYDTDSISKFHINWGWGELYNDEYFALDNLSPDHPYNSDQRALMEIYPICNVPTTRTNLSYTVAPGVLKKEFATTSITTNTVVVESGGDLIFTAPSIELGVGFEVKEGGSFEATLDPLPYCDGEGPGHP
jgi:hypothetical protein